MSRTAEIKLTVDLDSDDVPARIAWEASEARGTGPTPCQSMMLSLWDGEQKTIAAIDLWLKDTTIDDMNLYFYQAIHQMADTYLRATKNPAVAKMIHGFGERFGGAVGLVGNDGSMGAGRGDAPLDLISLAGGNQQRGTE
jgi:gliding motility-associated protein GldC